MGVVGGTFLLSFHPLYRGTWFPTKDIYHYEWVNICVSIRYIAVLGFQQHRPSLRIIGACV